MLCPNFTIQTNYLQFVPQLIFTVYGFCIYDTRIKYFTNLYWQEMIRVLLDISQTAIRMQLSNKLHKEKANVFPDFLRRCNAFVFLWCPTIIYNHQNFGQLWVMHCLCASQCWTTVFIDSTLKNQEYLVCILTVLNTLNLTFAVWIH